MVNFKNRNFQRGRQKFKDFNGGGRQTSFVPTNFRHTLQGKRGGDVGLNGDLPLFGIVKGNQFIFLLCGIALILIRVRGTGQLCLFKLKQLCQTFYIGPGTDK